MKKFQSVLCTLVLALSLSSTVLASNGILVSDVKADGILVSDLFDDVTGVMLNIFGVIHF